MLQAHRLKPGDDLFQRDAGRFLPAADGDLFAVRRVDAHVQRQHDRLCAELVEPRFHLFGRFYRRRADDDAAGARLQQRPDVVARANAAADLHHGVDAVKQRFQQRDLSRSRIFRAGKVHEVQHRRALAGVILQARQRIAAVVALLAVIALMQTHHFAVNQI